MASATRIRLAMPLLFLVLQHAATLSPPRATFPGDRAALASLKSAVDAATIPAYSCLASWDFARDPCVLRCYAPPNSSYLRVAGVSLDPAGYSGTLPAPVFASLPFLGFSPSPATASTLPAGAPLPPSLRVLDLSGNAFSGEIPASLFTPASSLEELYLSHNAFTRRIPSQVASLSALTRMELQYDRLTGSLPWMGKMRLLAYLDVSGNALSGSLLDAPGQLPRLIVSVMARNNSLSGPLHAAAFDALPAMRVLDLTSNAMTGAVPAAVFEEASDDGVSSQLVELDLSGNKLTGRLPRCLGAMPWLAVVGLDRNRSPEAYRTSTPRGLRWRKPPRRACRSPG